MLEYPEALVLAKALRETVVGKTVCRVLPPTKPHKFCWFSGDPADYNTRLCGSYLSTAQSFGLYAQLSFSNEKKLAVNDGVNVRLITDGSVPKDYQLLLQFTDGTALCFTVAMYGGIVLHEEDYDNEYYQKSRDAVPLLSAKLREHYEEILSASKPGLSAKAFLATNQRFPGLRWRESNPIRPKYRYFRTLVHFLSCDTTVSLRQKSTRLHNNLCILGALQF